MNILKNPCVSLEIFENVKNKVTFIRKQNKKIFYQIFEIEISTNWGFSPSNSLGLKITNW